MTQEKQNAVNAIEEKAGLIGDCLLYSSGCIILAVLKKNIEE